ncbi:hypothetical protein GPA27_03500 [Aromatoleum toluolicum]|uniref:Uncharacterized protein n=1 Tax=Aromatoleum toluolicum TaxID=90060 RepID=A0ABX1NAY7_9RHOO|nr:hypothetical protein [Aromatoleum toluolicum]NMF96457.1 hypothetical protein [Aromatoleum toluolicum]
MLKETHVPLIRKSPQEHAFTVCSIGGQVMKWLQGAIVLVLLNVSRRYGASWEMAAGTLSDAVDEVEVSQRRGDAADNGGRPMLRRVT